MERPSVSPQVSLDQFVLLKDFESAARTVLPHPVYEYIAGGAGDEITLRENESAFDRIRLWPRVLRNVRTVDPGVSIFGVRLRSPIILAPVAYQKTMHPLGELASVRGAGKAGVPFVVSTNTTTLFEDLAAAATQPLWFQLYFQRDRSETKDLIQRVETAGCQGICVTVDTPVLGTRVRQFKAGFQLPPGMDTPHNLRGGGARGDSNPDRHTPIDWSDVEWLRSVVRSKLWLKGVLHPEDAEQAVRTGSDGIMVSNHGARNLDTTVATIDVLPAICQQVSGRVPVIVDGGIRKGADIVKALARGAAAVMIGRPYVYALAVGGDLGVARCVELLERDFRYAMALVGHASVTTLDRTLEWPDKTESPAVN
jgi:4-hydroxymandelate oxidase